MNRTADLGEVSGIFAGDGTLYKTKTGFVMEVRGNSNEESYYQKHVKPNFEKLLSRKLRLIKRHYPGGYVIGIRSCTLKTKEIFHDWLGFPIGKKSGNVEIPKQVLNEKRYWKSYIRGIFDTDGSVYLRKSGPGMKYNQPVIDIASNSTKHLKQIKEIIEELGFNVWLEKSNNKVRMAGWKNAEIFFKVIKPHNNKKTERFEKLKLGNRVLGY
jgi:DNA-binding transcriptional regulator WhiA